MASLPVYEGPVDILRFGLKSLESGTNAPHPVAQLQKLQADAEWAGKMDMVRRTYGSHMAMRLSTERALLSRDHRLPGLQSTHAGLNTLTGADTKIDFTDFLSGTTTTPLFDAAHPLPLIALTCSGFILSFFSRPRDEARRPED
jgi:Proteasome maturation factor UMP1